MKRRLVGAVVLVSLAVIFLPMILEGRNAQDAQIVQTNIPSKPEEVREFKSSVVPIADDEPLIPPIEIEQRRPVPAVTPPPAPTPRPVVKQVEPVKPPAAVLVAPAVTPEVAPEPKVGIAAWVVQVVSLSNKNNADRLILDLRKKDFPAFIEQISVKGKTLYRVRVGPEIDRKRTEQMAEKIHRQFKLKGQVIRYP